jgi:hypothetical protein
MTPGFHKGIPMRDYLAMRAVSASLICTLVEQCPAAAWWKSWMNPKAPSFSSSAAADAGTIAHSVLLEGSESCVAVIDPAQYPAKNGNIPEGWTNPAIRTARDDAIAAGKVPMFPDSLVTVRSMVGAARTFIESLRESEPAIWALFQPDGGESELTMVWTDEAGVTCRARPDRISHDRRLVVDYKTGGTSAEPDAWARTQLVRMGYYVSAEFYRRGLKQLAGVDADYIFLVQEQEAPYLCSLVGVDPSGRELGARKVSRGLRTWAASAFSNEWPAYPPRVCYAELPPWEHAREDAVIDAHAIPYDVSKIGWPEARRFANEHDPA